MKYLLKNSILSLFVAISILFLVLFFSEVTLAAPLFPDLTEMIYENDISQEMVLQNSLKGNISGNELRYVNLSSFPEKPLNDNLRTGEFNGGDYIEVLSDSNIDSKKEEYFYKWSVEASGDNTNNPKNGYWIDITDFFDKKSPVSGYGISKFSFKLDLKKDSLRQIYGDFGGSEYYIRVKLDVSKRVDENNDSESKKSYLIIKFSDSFDLLQCSPAKLELGGKLFFDEKNIACSEKIDLNACRIIENEIISLRINDPENRYSNFQWYLNGNELKCNPSISVICDVGGLDYDTTFFPVVGSPGDVINISVSMDDLKSGEKKVVKRDFLIVNPEINILNINELENSDNKNIGLILGESNSNNLGNTTFVEKNGVVDLMIETVPKWIKSKVSLMWKVDGVGENRYSSDDRINFKVGRDPGIVHNVEIEGLFLQSPDLRKVLFDVWGVKEVDSAGKRIKSSIEVKVVDNLDIQKGLSNVSKNTPFFIQKKLKNIYESGFFLLKLTIISAIMILFPAIFLMIFPKK